MIGFLTGRVGPRLTAALVTAAFLSSLAFATVSLFHWPHNPLMAPTRWVVLAVPLITLLAFFAPSAPASRTRRLALVAFAMATIMTVPFAFTEAAFSTHDVNAMLVTARENQLDDMAQIGLGSFPGLLAGHALALVMLLAGARVITRNVGHSVPALALLTIAILAVSPVTRFVYGLVVPNPALALIDPPRDVRPPDILSKPVDKKNLVIIYLESIERTYGDIPETADAFAPLARIENAGVSARDIGQLYGTNFTIAGQVASQCGVPLYSRGVFHMRAKARDGFENGVDFTDFLTGTTCLGDVLTRDGYVASYMNGSDLQVFSKGDFFAAHGYSRLFGRGNLPGLDSETRTNIWGLNDEVLFEQAKTELARLSATGKPFVLSLLTISTHGPGALLDQNCAYPVGDLGDLPAAIWCTGNHVEDMIAEVGRLGLSENTVIAVMSDHLAMRNDLSDQIDAHVEAGGERRNFFVLLGLGRAGQISKPGATIDYFPTLLEALGYQLKDDRANMGVSLLSEQPTMTALMGLDTLNAALTGNTRLQEYLWDPQLAGSPSGIVVARK